MKARGAARLAWSLWTLAILSITATVWLYVLIRQAGRSELMGAPDPLLLIALVTAATMGAIVARRRPRHPVGWLMLGLAVFLGADGVSAAYAPYALLVRRDELPAATWMAAYFPSFALAALACVGFILLLTPTGFPPSARWCWWVPIMAAAPTVDLLAVTLAPKPSTSSYQAANSPFDFDGYSGLLLGVHRLASGVTVLAVLVGAWSLVVRFRRARGMERQQLRWVAFAAAVVGVLAVIGVVGLALGNAALRDPGAEVGVSLVPVAVGAAILRYRLYDLDHIINRTLVYGTLTAVLALVYVAGVVGIGGLLRQVAGEETNSLVVAASTLAVAALFRPVRARVQGFIDRRFYRSRYDAARTLDEFSHHLRDKVTLDAVSNDLLVAVQETLQPTHTSLWLRQRS